MIGWIVNYLIVCIHSFGERVRSLLPVEAAHLGLSVGLAQEMGVDWATKAPLLPWKSVLDGFRKEARNCRNHQIRQMQT